MKYQLACITGASSGLGKAIAECFADQGISLLLTGRNPKALEEVACTLRNKVSVITHCADLADLESRRSLVALLHQHTPDLLINNAGIGLYGDVLSHSTEEELKILEVNANALLELTLEGARALFQAQKKGTILNVSSAAAFFVFPSFSVYTASKAFVNTLSQSLDLEFAPHGIRILCACPGQIETAFRTRAAQGRPQKLDGQSMSAKKAARLLLAQINKAKSLNIIDWRYRIATFFARFFIPKKLLAKILRSSIQNRL